MPAKLHTWLACSLKQKIGAFLGIIWKKKKPKSKNNLSMLSRDLLKPKVKSVSEEQFYNLQDTYYMLKHPEKASWRVKCSGPLCTLLAGGCLHLHREHYRGRQNTLNTMHQAGIERLRPFPKRLSVANLSR